VKDPSNSSSPRRDRSRTPSGEAVRFLVVGRVLGPLGINGDVRVRLLTDFPGRFEHLQTVHLGDNLRPYRVGHARLEGGTVVLHLSGVDDAATAQSLANQDVQVPISEAVALPPDQFYVHEIVGLEVWTDAGRRLGNVVDVLRTGSNDVYVVRSGAQELLLPVIEDVVQSIDPASRRIVVHLLPGLED
jgi:16S rRNA processing protein RimM